MPKRVRIKKPKPKPKGGRPSKMNEECVELIERGLRLGLSFKTAAALADLDESTLHRWRKRFAWLRTRLARAKAEGVERMATKMLELANKGHYGAIAFWLSRRAPEFRKIAEGLSLVNLEDNYDDDAQSFL